MAAPLKTQRTVRFSKQPSVRSQNLRETTMMKQASRRIKSKTSQFPTSTCWWVNPQGEWIQCQIVSQEDDTVTIKNDNSELDVGISSILPFNSDIVADMTSLRYLHEPGILYNLKHRLLNKFPYTYMGSILISVNPFEWLPGPDFREFVGKSLNPENPHPYAIAELCSQQINIRNPQNQSIVISGESGSGKTESAKMVLNHIVNRGNINFSAQGTPVLSESTDAISSLEERLMKSSPLLEAFGNAKTVRNSNSSRFGKYIRMFFQPLQNEENHGIPIAQCVRKIAGATIETYLLEKSRVTSHAPEERNYHVFYYLVLAKASDLFPVKLSHTSFQDYILLNSLRQSSQVTLTLTKPTTTTAVPARGRGLEKQVSRLLRQDFQDQVGITDGLIQFKEIQEALQALNYSSVDICSIWNIVGSVLEIGNISFEELETPEGNVADVVSASYLPTAALLLGITEDKLRSCLTTTSSTVRGETILKPLNLRDSINAKNAICKSIYSSLFHYIVGTINIALSNNSYFFEDACTSIGVLDIFGFESFRKNEFEQLLINYANEVLQSSFNTHVFHNELMLYQSENITTNLTLDQCPNNDGCVTLLDSVLNTLETVSERNIPPNELFFETINKQFETNKNNLEKSKYFLLTHPKDKKSEFKIKHYAETVTYHAGERDSCSWGLKNNDKIPKELKSILIESSDKIIVEMILIDNDVRVTPSSMAVTASGTPSGAATGTAGGGGGGGGGISPFSFSSESNESTPTSARTNSLNLTTTTTIKSSSPMKGIVKKNSIAGEFKNSIASLCLTLSQSNCAFIRCIKPNPLLQPLTYDEKYTLQQIKSLGLVQVCSVMSIGLPTRITYLELKSLLHSLLSDIEPLFVNETQEVFIASLLYAFKIPSEIYQLGRTRLFFKSGQLDVLEEMLTTNYELKREEIIQRVHEALEERRKCDQLIEKLKKSEIETNEILNRHREDCRLKKIELMELSQQNKEEIQRKYSQINLNTLGELMSSCQFAIEDVQNYGQNLRLSHPEEFQPIQDSINTSLTQLTKLESSWNILNKCNNKLELYLQNHNFNSIEECYKPRQDVSSRSSQEMSLLNHAIHEIIFDSNRCLIAQALRKGEEISRQLQELKEKTEFEVNNSLLEYQNLKKDENNQQISNLEAINEMERKGNESRVICEEIQMRCHEMRGEIDQLRKKIIDDEERLQEEIRRAEEQENLDRQRREMEAALEYELKEQARIGLEETEKMIVEDRLSREREKEERFGRNISTKLISIAEGEETEHDDGSESETKTSAAAPPALPVFPSSSSSSSPHKPSLFTNQKISSTDPSNDPLPPPPSSSTTTIPTPVPTPAPAPTSAVSRRIKELDPRRQQQQQQQPAIHHEGQLLKQSGFLGMWKHKYFVLDNDVLKYYKHEKDKLENNGSCKIFVLLSTTGLAYAKLSLVFKVMNEDTHEELCLMANSKETLDLWIEKLKLAISTKYSSQRRRSSRMG